MSALEARTSGQRVLCEEFPRQDDRRAGEDGGREAQAVRRAVVQGQARVHSIAGLEFQVHRDAAGGVEFSAAQHDDGFGQTCRAGGVEQTAYFGGRDALVQRLGGWCRVAEG